MDEMSAARVVRLCGNVKGLGREDRISPEERRGAERTKKFSYFPSLSQKVVLNPGFCLKTFGNVLNFRMFFFMSKIIYGYVRETTICFYKVYKSSFKAK